MRESEFLGGQQQLIGKFKAIKAFQSWSDPHLEQLLAISKIQTYSRREVIFKEDEINHCLYFLIAGEVLISRLGKRLSIIKTSGELLGELGTFDPGPRELTALAIEESVCMAVELDHLETLPTDQRAILSEQLRQLVIDGLAGRLLATINLQLALMRELAGKGSN